jgi:hypothetical protein
MFYLKLLEHGRFARPNSVLEQIHHEIVAPIPIIVPNWPLPGREVAVRHPVTDEWITTVCVSYKRGRVVSQAGSELVHIPLVGLFWDGKIWREARRRSDAPRRRALSQFTTVPQTSDSGLGTKPSMRRSALGSAQPFPTMPEPAMSDTRALLHTGGTLLSTSQFIDRRSEPVQPFRGIYGPVAAQHTAIVRTAPARRPTQYIQDVVNIAFGADVGYGRRLRKFNVRVENVLTHRSQYNWVAEDEITPEDAERLTDLYRKHIQGKLTIIPGL